jgi:hypothetical protein
VPEYARLVGWVVGLMFFSIEIGSNNAGVLTKNRTRSCDGLELHFATNHIGTVRPLFATFSDESLLWIMTYICIYEQAIFF